MCSYLLTLACMDTTDPFIIVAAGSVIGILLAPFASRMIAIATEQLIPSVSDTVGDLSRVRRRRR